MKTILLYFWIITFGVLFPCVVYSQDSLPPPAKFKPKLYAYWGWNRAGYTKSNIRFWGTDYNFELQKVVAHDRPTPFGVNPYLRVDKITVPQNVVRIGFQFCPHWEVSIGHDHMKYVMDQDQTVKINGVIGKEYSKFQGDYVNQDMVLADSFLTFEHTDGLNYENLELRHISNLFERGFFRLDAMEGLGFGVIVPRTNTQLMGNNRYDQFHFSGYGFDALVGARATFWKYFFLQSEVKGGFLNLPDIRTTEFTTDRASQNLFFIQWNWSFGLIVSL